MAGGSVFDDLTQRLEQNGGMTEKQHRDFVVLALREIYRGVEKISKLEDRVEVLEESNLIMLMKRHPKESVAVGIFFLGLTVATVGHLGLWAWVLHLLGIPVP